MQLSSDVDVKLLELRVELQGRGSSYDLTIADWADVTVRESVRVWVEPAEVYALRETVGVRRAGGTDSLDPAQQLGGRLFDAIFGRRGGRAYKQALSISSERGRALRLRLVLDDDLLRLPWELLYDREFRNDFLVLGQGMTLVRQRPGMVRPVEHPVSGPLRVLVVAWGGPTTSPYDTEGEIDGIAAAMGEHAEIEVLKDPSRELLFEALSVPRHVLQYIGTGVEHDGGAQGIVLSGREPRPMTGAELAEVVRAVPDLQLVVLNGCRTDRVAADLSAVVPVVIGTQGDITDKGAIIFAHSLYEQIAAGAPLEMALAMARRLVDYEIPGRLDWSAPVMYMWGGGMSLVARPGGDDTSSSAALPPTPNPSTDADAARQQAERRLNIDELNLKALRGNADQFGDKVPATITSQLKELEKRVERARADLGIAESE